MALVVVQCLKRQSLVQRRKGKEWQSLTLLTKTYITKWSFNPMFNTVQLRNLNRNFQSTLSKLHVLLMYHAIPASPMPPGNPLEFWHQSTSTGGPIPVSRTSSLRPLLRMLRFTTAGQGERRRCVRQSMSRNSERTLQQRQRWAGKITDHYRLWNSEKSCACLFTNTNHRHRISYCVSSEQRQSNPISLG